MSALVAYFSATGTTARVARTLAETVGADLFEIRPEQPYTAADLNWNDRRSRSSREMADEKCRPAVAGDAPDMGRYDTVFLGFPIWWYVEPRIIDTFLEAHDFAGKTIVPFATSGGSGLGRAPERVAALAPGATVTEGRLLNGPLSTDDLRAWALA
ncbi:flavodoxin [Olsenella uli]|uniref:flavodoxin n=1 Tax=Olsenella uli TaxID=133926 RepID=UPI00195DBAEE|nr:flavodoxin [Olsenella uli]MBM6675691.1 flavodoxin [Olsenella uli]